MRLEPVALLLLFLGLTEACGCMGSKTIYETEDSREDPLSSYKDKQPPSAWGGQGAPPNGA